VDISQILFTVRRGFYDEPPLNPGQLLTL